MRKFVISLLSVVVALTIVFSSCNTVENTDEENENSKNQSSFTNSKGKSTLYTKYGLPLPVEVANLLKEKGIEFRVDLMNPVENADRYFTDLSKAINLGFYSTDLTFCTIYDKAQESVNYFSVSIELARDLDITEGYNENVLDRTYDNLNNNDTLSFIAAEAYWVTCSHLEKNNKVNILPYIIIGSWLESQYIFANIVEKDMPDSTLYKDFYKQLAHADALINYLFEVMADSNAFLINDEIQKIVNQLKPIQESYKLLRDKEINKEALLPSIELIKKMRLEYIK